MMDLAVLHSHFFFDSVSSKTENPVQLIFDYKQQKVATSWSVQHTNEKGKKRVQK